MSEIRRVLNVRKQRLNEMLRQYYELERILGFHYSELVHFATNYWHTHILHRAIVHLNAEFLMLKYFLIVLHQDMDDPNLTHVLYEYIETLIGSFVSKLKLFERLKRAYKR